jgi:flagellar hook-basal body complex protein FliE
MIPALSFLAPLASQVVGDISGNSVGVLPGATAGSSDDFGAILAQVSGDAMADLKTSEANAISGIEGKMPVQQVVQSVLDAQSALQTALAIRDKVVGAYQELSRMAI